MKPGGIFILQKALFSVSILLDTHFEQIFDKKCIETLVVEDSIIYEVHAIYSILQLLTEWGGNEQLLTKKYPLLLNFIHFTIGLIWNMLKIFKDYTSVLIFSLASVAFELLIKVAKDILDPCCHLATGDSILLSRHLASPL
jgi:hypothetical protein